MLRAAGISKRFGSVQALAGVDFEVDAGEVVALAGENGSGKSTLSRILSGVIRPDSGEIALDARRVELSRPLEALRAGIAIVTQEVTAVPALSVAENVLLPTERSLLSAYRRRAVVREARRALEQVQLSVDPSAAFSSLNPGQAVLAELARALVSAPRLLILDEVTTRIGGPDVDRLFALLSSLAAGGMGIVLITHRLVEITALADRTVVLRDGRRVGELRRGESSEDRISAMMVGRDVEEFQRRPIEPSAPPRLELRGLVVAGLKSPVSLSVRAGEVVGMSGLVGAGRSEVLETIVGRRPATGGEVLVDGRPLPLGNVRATCASGVALVPEDRRGQGLLMEAPVSTNVALGRWRAWSRASKSRELALLHRFGPRVGLRLRRRADPLVNTLSGGNQQKVLFARALATSPKVLLLDEPTRGIDVGAREEIFTLVGELLLEGMAVLMASSDMRELLALSHRIVVLHDREVVAELDATEASEERLALLGGGGR